MSPQSLPVHRGESGATASSAAGRPLLSFELPRRDAPRASTPRPSSLREAIARWLDQPL